ncbi:MAG: hypothetical protein ACYS9X_16845 [Planctomycetota bacterium]|jgi:hypothetical protein
MPDSQVPVGHGTDQSEVVDVASAATIIRSAVEPLAEAQQVAAKEGTKRAELVTGYMTKVLYITGALAFTVILIAGGAFFFGKEEVAREIVIGAVSFVGGLGIGRATRPQGLGS